jgi:hypothetical protein
MKKIVHDYYSGFEGEPEIIFLQKNNTDEEILKLWIGYFDKIMSQVSPGPNGWEALALYYHLHTGWYENDNWRIPEIKEALSQIETVRLSDKNVELIKKELESFLRKAMLNRVDVFIRYS